MTGIRFNVLQADREPKNCRLENFIARILGIITNYIKKLHSLFKGPVKLRETYVYECFKEGSYMILLGFLVAITSLGIDFTTSQILKGRNLLYEKWGDSALIQYTSWTGFIAILFVLSAAIAHFIGPKSKGSGIPEIKSVLQGCLLEDIFTVPTLIAKCMGLILATGTGMPVGREGPFIHIACILAALLHRTFYRQTLKEEQNYREYLVIACAVGVACCFSAPIGGVLFSIEVTSTYFAVKNYWRGFFCAITGALIFKILDMLFHGEGIVTTFYRMKFTYNFFMYPKELGLFIGIGIVCGLLASLFIIFYKAFHDFLNRENSFTKHVVNRWWLYTLLVALIIASLSFPQGLGRYYNSQMAQPEYIRFLFYNYTSLTNNETLFNYLEFAEFAPHLLEKFQLKPHPETNIGIFIFILIQFVSTILIISAPISTGLFVPVFALGAAIGKLYGNMVGVIFYPNLEKQYPDPAIISGIYSMIGAASLAGGVTRTISTSVIVFEITGQMTHLLPTMISVLIANAVSACFVPSIYNVIITCKKLPYLPDITIHYHRLRKLKAGDIMEPTKCWPYIHQEMTINELICRLLKPSTTSNLIEYPVLKNSSDMTFITNVLKEDLIHYIEHTFNKERWIYINKKHNSLQCDLDFLKVIPNKINQIEYDIWKREKQEENIDFDLLSGNKEAVCVQISPSLPFQKVHELFTILNVEYLYVTKHGKLLGVIAFSDLINMFRSKLMNTKTFL